MAGIDINEKDIIIAYFSNNENQNLKK